MSQAPNIDGVLIQWGDRLFYPGNRVVKVKPQPKLAGGAATQRAAAIRERIEATVVRRAPQVMVKVTGVQTCALPISRWPRRSSANVSSMGRYSWAARNAP